MSKTRKRVLSVLTILFAIALVFTACRALAGCGDDEGDTKKNETTWPASGWTVYRFDGTKDDADCIFAVYENGWFVFGSESVTPDDYTGGENGGTIGVWGYLDNELVFVRVTRSFYMGNAAYVLCDMTTNADGSVTISNDNISGTIDDIGKIQGTGYDLTTIEISE